MGLKIALFMVIAFAIGTCETPRYSSPQLVGTYSYEGKEYQIVSMTYQTNSSGGSAYFLYEPGTDDYFPHKAAASCLDTSLEACRTEFGKQLRAAGSAVRDEGGMY
ncbi:hypothetical protein [uncultured Litoreibacter sp.]|uniref:hypothetical protein n=1 Tax=uncultured Litoreibacter sp. TaxID=1392394 RepID=UPI002623DA8C|nr:hypothetical protein [uncultured Litoreibacter sp.]